VSFLYVFCFIISSVFAFLSPCIILLLSVLASDCQYIRQLCPFPGESVGALKGDEASEHFYLDDSQCFEYFQCLDTASWVTGWASSLRKRALIIPRGSLQEIKPILE